MKRQARIVDGYIAPEPIPWVVALWSPDVRTLPHFCTGTILDEFTVLTAAHCINEDPTKNGTFIRLMVMAGSTKPQAGINILVERVIFAKDMWEYPTMTAPRLMQADMAILKLSKAMPFDDTIMPLCLPTKPIKYVTGLECIIAGWGIMSSEFIL